MCARYALAIATPTHSAAPYRPAVYVRSCRRVSAPQKAHGNYGATSAARESVAIFPSSTTAVKRYLGAQSGPYSRVGAIMSKLRQLESHEIQKKEKINIHIHMEYINALISSFSMAVTMSS